MTEQEEGRQFDLFAAERYTEVNTGIPLLLGCVYLHKAISERIDSEEAPDEYRRAWDAFAEIERRIG